MDLFILSFTSQGAEIGEKLGEYLIKNDHTVKVFAKYPLTKSGLIQGDLEEFISKIFKKSDGIIFIGALGIAVRSVAPFIVSKDKDPAGIVIDDTAKYVIPFLSGHLGGANQLASEIAAFLDAECVVTTSTDRNGVFAIDSWAKKYEIVVLDINLIKNVSAKLLKGEKVGFSCDFTTKGNLPDGFVEDLSLETGVSISFNKEKRPFKNTLRLIPKDIFLGVGCKKGTENTTFDKQVQDFLNYNNLSEERIRTIASIDLKKDEACILNFAESRKIPFKTFPSSSLAEVGGDFSSSEFVKKVTGVDNVCERAACLLSGGRVTYKKYTGNGVSVAASIIDFVCRFEEKDKK